MALELPLTFTLDAGRELTYALEEDTFGTVSDLQLSVYGTPFWSIANSATGLLVRNTELESESLKAEAFNSGAAVVAGAFDESDMEPEVRAIVAKVLSIRSVPSSLLSQKSEEILRAFEVVAREGHEAHREMSRATSLVMEYYASITPQARIARIAFCGAGFMIYQLDKALEYLRNNEIDRICRTETTGLDWDSFPR